MCVIAKTVILDAPIGHILNPCKNAKSLVLCNFVYLINISKLAVDVLAQFQQQAYRTLVEDMQVEEQGEQPLGESRILCTRQADGSQHTRRCTCTQISKLSNSPKLVSLQIFTVQVIICTNCRWRCVLGGRRGGRWYGGCCVRCN